MIERDGSQKSTATADGCISVEAGGETLVLLGEKGIYWPRKRTLLVADCHFGKSATLRAQSAAIPGGSTQADLDRLSRMILGTKAERLLFLGDVLDSRVGRTEGLLDHLDRWRRSISQMEIAVVRGNHDQRAGDPPADWGWICHDEPLDDEPFAFRHHPDPVVGRFVLGGHIHPSVRLSGPGRQSERLPCFLVEDRVAVLPAFGALTGTHIVRPSERSRVFVVAAGKIFRVN